MAGSSSCSASVVAIDQLRTRQQTLDQRLEEGYRRIADAEIGGQDVTAWENFWLDLLREYEAICEELEQAA